MWHKFCLLFQRLKVMRRFTTLPLSSHVFSPTVALDDQHLDKSPPMPQEIYESVGPQGADRAIFINSEGPVYHLHYQPRTKIKRPEIRLEKGKIPVHILVGSGDQYDRVWMSEWAKEAADEIATNEILGLQQIIIDEEKYRPVGAEHFIAHDILDIGDMNKRSLAQTLLAYLEENNMVAVGANTFLQAYIRMVPVVQEAIQHFNNPGILVHPAKAVAATVDKMTTRMIVGENIASLKWPAASPGTIIDPDIEEKALHTFQMIQKTTPSGKVVLKLATAAGKAGLRADGIETKAQMREAIRSVMKEINEYWGNKDAALRTTYIEDERNGPSRLLIEGMIDRYAEVDVELSMSILQEGSLDITGFIIGNPHPGDKEKGYLFGMDDLLSHALQRMLILKATEAIVAIWHQFGGLAFGNFHVEMMLRGDAADPKPALVEINAIRPIGGNGIRLAKEWNLQINLIANGVRASLGLPQIAPTTPSRDSLLALGITSAVRGIITKIHSTFDPNLHKELSDFGKEDAITKKMTDPLFLPFLKVGQHVEGADCTHADRLGAVIGRGKNASDAICNVLKALHHICYEITMENGKVFTQKGSEEHGELDYRKLPSDRPHLTQKAAYELDVYEEAQLRWAPIFQIYYPLFSALMNAIGGLAAIGLGRVGYTLALFIATPFASAVAAHFPVKKVLTYTWLVRIGIWAILIPAAVYLLSTHVMLFKIPMLDWGVTSLSFAILILNFLDGLMVSLSHTVDMDTGGMDMIAQQNGFQNQMTPEVRKHYGTRYMAWTSKAQFIFPLGIALAIAAASMLTLPIMWAFVAGMAGIFLIQGGRALRSLTKMNGNIQMKGVEHSYWKECIDGVKMVVKDRKLLGLVTLETLQCSMGYTLIMVVLPMLSLFAIKPALHLDDAGANLATTILMSVMSYAGMKASIAARKNWKAPEKGMAEHPAYEPLYKQMFLAAIALLSTPGAYYLILAEFTFSGLVLAAAGAAGFMVAFKKAQIGTMNMFQTAACGYERSTRIFGIASAVSMLFSGFAVWGLSTLFLYLSTGSAFLGVAAFFLAIGTAYWVIWPAIASQKKQMA